MADALNLWLHLVFAALWVGPQAFLFVAVVPGLRRVTDPAVRAQALRVVVYRYAWLSLAAGAVLIGTGTENILHANDTNFAAGPGMMEYRYGVILVTKLAMVAVAMALTAYHSLVIGPRQLRLLEEGGDERELARWRAQSVAISAVNLALALGILLTAAMLRIESFSLQLR